MVLYNKIVGVQGLPWSQTVEMGDFTNINDENNEIRYIQRNEWETKSRNGTDSSNRAFSPKPFPDEENPDRCPVRAYLAYRDHWPNSMLHPDAPFYFAINYNRPNISSAWFKKNAMGNDRIGQIMSRMAMKAKLAGKFKNHSVWRSMCQCLIRAG